MLYTMNILLLEDTLSLNNAMKELLEIEGHMVYPFSDGNDVLKHISNEIDLYLLDITVPNVNGLELLKLIMDYNPLSEVIMISSDQSLTSLQTAYNSGCLDYIKKPFLLEELQLKVANIDKKVSSKYNGIKFKDSIHSLTKKEKALLDLLIRFQEDIVTPEMISNFLYPEEHMSMDAMRSLVKRLRLKLAQNSIVTISGQGFLLKVS